MASSCPALAISLLRLPGVSCRCLPVFPEVKCRGRGDDQINRICLDLKQMPTAWLSSKSTQQFQPFWSYFLPSRFIYSSDLADIDTAQLSELWAKTLNVRRDPKNIAKALQYSYAFVVVLDQGEQFDPSRSSYKRMVGFGRAVSDGAFVATICDVAVDPDYQRRGIGRRIVKELVRNMKRKGGPTGFAVFPPPRARRFFWTMGFRSDRQFCFMIYRGRLANGGKNYSNIIQGLICEDHS